jgi:hypothetical protein
MLKRHSQLVAAVFTTAKKWSNKNVFSHRLAGQQCKVKALGGFFPSCGSKGKSIQSLSPRVWKPSLNPGIP